MIKNSRIDACELDDEPKILAEMAEAKGWPIICVTEFANGLYYPDYETAPDFYGEYFFDTKKLVEDPAVYRDMGCIRYVAYILESSLAGHSDTTASRKYSFGDTKDWWDAFAPNKDDIEGREVIQIAVAVNY